MKRDVMQDVESRLRAEAKMMREKDGFSPLLHERIMAKLRAEGLRAVPITPEPGVSWWRYAGPVAAAAGVALAAWLILRPAAVEPAPRPVAGGSEHIMVNMPQIAVTQRPLDATTSALEERKYAYLDRDARKLLVFVADQLPSLPEGK